MNCTNCNKDINVPAMAWNLPEPNVNFPMSGQLCDECSERFGKEMFQNFIEYNKEI